MNSHTMYSAYYSTLILLMYTSVNMHLVFTVHNVDLVCIHNAMFNIMYCVHR